MGERWSAQLLNTDDQVIGELPGVRGGQLDWSIFKSVPGYGSIAFVDAPGEVDWMTSRIRILHHVDDAPPTPVGVWIPSVPAWDHDWAHRSTTVGLLDKTQLLNRSPGRWVSVGVDVAVTDWVRQTIADVAGEVAAIDDSPAHLSTPQVFDPLESTWLSIINAVLQAIGHQSLSASLAGVLTSARYQPPEERTPVGVVGGQAGDLRMRPQFRDEAGVFNVPNVVVVIVPATDRTPMLRGEARNDDPNSPVSTSNVGERVVVEEGEAANQAAVDALAARRLAELSQITRRVTWTHPVDRTALDDVVEFRPLNLERLAIVQRSISLDVGAVVESTGRRIYTGGDSPW